MPRPEPIGAASGITATQPMSSSRLRDDRVVGGVGHHVEALLTRRLGGVERLHDVGEQRLRVAEHLELDQLVPSSSSRARRQVRTASSAV